MGNDIEVDWNYLLLCIIGLNIIIIPSCLVFLLSLSHKTVPSQGTTILFTRFLRGNCLIQIVANYNHNTMGGQTWKCLNKNQRFFSEKLPTQNNCWCYFETRRLFLSPICSSMKHESYTGSYRVVAQCLIVTVEASEV